MYLCGVIGKEFILLKEWIIAVKVVKALAAIFVFCDDELNLFFHFVCKFVPLFRCDIEQGFFLNRKQIYSVVRKYRTTQKEKTEIPIYLWHT